MSNHTVRGLVVGIMATLVMLVGAVPAHGHAELTSSDPKDGSRLESAPAALSFTFGEQVLEQGNAVTLTDVASGARLQVGPLEVDGDTVSVAWPDQSPAGQFRAAYRVVSADGHPIAGTITFTVDQPVGAAVVSSATASGAGSPWAEVSAGGATTAGTPAPTSGSEAEGGASGWILALAAAVLVGVGAGTWVMRRTR